MASPFVGEFAFLCLCEYVYNNFNEYHFLNYLIYSVGCQYARRRFFKSIFVLFICLLIYLKSSIVNLVIGYRLKTAGNPLA